MFLDQSQRLEWDHNHALASRDRLFHHALHVLPCALGWIGATHLDGLGPDALCPSLDDLCARTQLSIADFLSTTNHRIAPPERWLGGGGTWFARRLARRRSSGLSGRCFVRTCCGLAGWGLGRVLVRTCGGLSGWGFGRILVWTLGGGAGRGPRRGLGRVLARTLGGGAGRDPRRGTRGRTPGGVDLEPPTVRLVCLCYGQDPDRVQPCTQRKRPLARGRIGEANGRIVATIARSPRGRVPQHGSAVQDRVHGCPGSTALDDSEGGTIGRIERPRRCVRRPKRFTRCGVGTARTAREDV